MSDRYQLIQNGETAETIADHDAEAYLFREGDVWRLVCYLHPELPAEVEQRGSYTAMSALKSSWFDSVTTRDDIESPTFIEYRTSDPGSPTVGRIWLRTDL